jgi:hypothetical protein
MTPESLLTLGSLLGLLWVLDKQRKERPVKVPVKVKKDQE